MKYLKKFNESSLLIYEKDWEKYLPLKLTLNYNQKDYTFRKGNVMLLADEVQITYESIPHVWGAPDTLEFDIYFVKDIQSGKLRLDVDITYGDVMACEFSVEAPNKVKVIQHTTYHSKFDPSNTDFALENQSLQEFVDFLNKFEGMKLTVNDFKFLDKYDNYNPN